MVKVAKRQMEINNIMTESWKNNGTDDRQGANDCGAADNLINLFISQSN